MHRLFICALPLIAASSIAAQNPAAIPTGANRAIYSISGIVIDSLRQRPLAGADVIVAGTAHHATTDSSGLFRIDSLEPGKYRLGVFHPYLDSLSLAIGTRETVVPLEEGQGIVFGVPSVASLIRNECPSTDVDSSSILMGTVVDVDTGTPIPSAKVTVSWTEYTFGKKIRGLQKVPQKLETITNSSGAYRVCGLPADLGAAVVARSGDAATDEIGIRSFAPSVMLVTLAISRNPAAKVSLAGFVRDEKGAPLKSARIQMIGAASAAVTDEDGHFTLSNLSPGSRSIAIRRIGYIPASISVQLSARSSAPLDIRLAKYVPILDTVFILGRRDQGLASIGFSQRKKNGAGEFLLREDIEKMHPGRLTDVLANMRQVTISYENGQPVAKSRRGYGCTRLVIDGTPWTLYDARELNDVIEAQEISALEVYSGTSVPSEFQNGPDRNCLTIVVWSRTRVRDLLR